MNSRELLEKYRKKQGLSYYRENRQQAYQHQTAAFGTSLTGPGLFRVSLDAHQSIPTRTDSYQTGALHVPRAKEKESRGLTDPGVLVKTQCGQ